MRMAASIDSRRFSISILSCQNKNFKNQRRNIFPLSISIHPRVSRYFPTFGNNTCAETDSAETLTNEATWCATCSISSKIRMPSVWLFLLVLCHRADATGPRIRNSAGIVEGNQLLLVISYLQSLWAFTGRCRRQLDTVNVKIQSSLAWC